MSKWVIEYDTNLHYIVRPAETHEEQNGLGYDSEAEALLQAITWTDELVEQAEACAKRLGDRLEGLQSQEPTHAE